MMYPPDRHGDNRWNQCQDLLIETWNKLGPDFTVSYLRMSARAQVDAYGMVQMEMAGAKQVRDEPEDAATEAG